MAQRLHMAPSYRQGDCRAFEGTHEDPWVKSLVPGAVREEVAVALSRSEGDIMGSSRDMLTKGNQGTPIFPVLHVPSMGYIFPGISTVLCCPAQDSEQLTDHRWKPPKL